MRMAHKVPAPPTGIQPSARDLADAPVVGQWWVFTIPAGTLLAGFADRRVITDRVLAMDSHAGWARVSSGWLVLGEPARERSAVPIDWTTRLRHDPLPNDAEGMVAWAKRNLFD
jgi:hypothetical protein